MGDPARGTGEKGAPVQRGPAPQSTVCPRRAAKTACRSVKMPCQQPPVNHRSTATDRLLRSREYHPTFELGVPVSPNRGIPESWKMNEAMGAVGARQDAGRTQAGGS